MLHTMRDWLGMKRHTAVAGLYLGPSHLSMAVVRPDPLRLIALGRQPVQDAAVVNDEVRLAVTLAADLSSVVKSLRLPDGVGVVAAIEPRDRNFRAIDDETGSSCAVRQAAHDRLVGAIHGAGLKLVRVDPVPASLARLGRTIDPRTVALRGAYRWSILTGDGYTEAERSDHYDDPRLRVGPDLATVGPPDRMPIKAGRRVRAVVDLDRDAIAIGAALAGFDRLPLVEVVPAPEVRGGDWAVQQVAGPRRSDQPSQWSKPTTSPPSGKARTQ